MKSISNYILILFVLIAIGLIIWARNADSKKSYIWNKTYKEGYKQPYDFGLFKDVLKSSVKSFKEIDQEPLRKTLEKSGKKHSTYVYVGLDHHLTYKECDALYEFVKRGNDAVIIAEELSWEFTNQIMGPKGQLSTLNFFDREVYVKTKFTQSKLGDYKFKNYKHSELNTDWYYINLSDSQDYYFGDTGQYFYDFNYLTLGTINGLVNFIKIKLGDGHVYINSSPMLMTNYALKDEQGFQYMNEVLSGVGKDSVIYDIGSRKIKKENREDGREDSPLSYILRQKSLKTAWYLLLALAVFFLLFKAKRKQRVIPVLETKKNHSLNFIRTLSSMFFMMSNNREMAQSAMNSFLFFVRNKLHVSTTHIDESLVQKISIKSGVDAAIVSGIFEYYEKIKLAENKKISSKMLIELDNRISHFYQLYNKSK
ncbi:MAG TPA: DUF4350 domain-containing protein [Bacteroidia bacterium]